MSSRSRLYVTIASRASDLHTGAFREGRQSKTTSHWCACARPMYGSARGFGRAWALAHAHTHAPLSRLSPLAPDRAPPTQPPEKTQHTPPVQRERERELRVATLPLAGLRRLSPVCATSILSPSHARAEPPLARLCPPTDGPRSAVGGGTTADSRSLMPCLFPAGGGRVHAGVGGRVRLRDPWRWCRWLCPRQQTECRSDEARSASRSR